MWKEKIKQLHIEFPGVVKLYKPASLAQLSVVESALGISLDEFDPVWKEFLLMTNGAEILGYLFFRADARPSIEKSHFILGESKHSQWAYRNFIEFLSTETPLLIGFVRDETRSRCVAQLDGSGSNSALPIASSFECFMNLFLEDAVNALRDCVANNEDLESADISSFWEPNLSFFCKRDTRLKAMLKNGELDDLFRANKDYSDLVDAVC